MTDKVQVEIKAPVATITLNKPERLNALDVEMWEGVGEACRAVDAARDRGFVVAVPELQMSNPLMPQKYGTCLWPDRTMSMPS